MLLLEWNSCWVRLYIKFKSWSWIHLGKQESMF